MGYLVPAQKEQNSPQSTSSTSATDVSGAQTNVSGLQACDYLVIYRAAFGGNDASMIGEVKIVSQAGTELGLVSAEGNGIDEPWGTAQLQGFARYTPSGSLTDSLKMQHRCVTSSDLIETGGIQILGIPLSQTYLDDGFGTVLFQDARLTDDADYFYDGTNSSSDEITGIANTWTTARTVDFTAMTAGDYIVLASSEVPLNSTNAADSAEWRFQIDATTQGVEYHKESEDAADIFNFAYADVVTLAAGTHTFRVQVQNRAANAVVSCRRSRLWAFRVSSFTQVAQVVDSTGVSSITNTSYDNTNVWLSLAHTPAVQSPAVALLGTTNYGNSTTTSALGQLQVSTGTAFCTDMGESLNDAGNDSGDDLCPTLLVGYTIPGVMTASTYRVRNRVGSASTGTAGRNAGNSAGVRSNLFAWELVTPELSPILGPDGGVIPSHEI